MQETVLPDRVLGAKAELLAKVRRADGTVEDLGVISTRVVTDAFVALIVDALMGNASLTGFKYHQSGTGTTAESVSDTDLEAPVGSRVEGSQTKYAANVYETQATISYSGSYSITEHGVFNAATGGTLMDRSVFSAINVANGDSITFTYRITFNAGG